MVKTHTKIKWLLYAISFLACIFTIVITYWYFFTRTVVYSDDARIDADMVDLAPQIPGSLIAVSVEEGEEIKKGQMLFELDSTLLRASLEKAGNDLISAQKSLAIAETEFQKALNGPRKEETLIAESALKSAEDTLKLAKTEWERVNQLYQAKSVTESEWDKARTNYNSTQNSYNSTKENLCLLQEGTRDEDKTIAKENVELKKAQIASYESVVRQASINLNYATICAPFDGVVVRQWRKPGSVLTQGTPVLTVLDTSTFHVSANIEEKYLNRLTPGDEADISIDAYPGHRLTGRLDTILQAANSKFSLIPSEGVSGTYIKVTQRIPVRINLDRPENIASLHLGPGLSVVVHIHTNNHKSRKIIVEQP